MMKTFYAIVIFLLSSLSASSQIIRWNTAPKKGFVFQISNKEAKKLLTISSPDTIFNGLLHTLVDSFNVEKGWIEGHRRDTSSWQE
jgi:hypothetical protein